MADTNPPSDRVVKLIDFGLSHVYPRVNGRVDRSRPLRDVCGSKSYAAPEVLAGRGYDGFAADIWSLGVSLFAMLSGFFPLDEASSNDWRFAKLREAQASNRSTTSSVYAWYRRSASHLSAEVIDLLDGLLRIDPDARLNMQQVREHPWVLGTQFPPIEPDQANYNREHELELDAPIYRGLLKGGYEEHVIDSMALDEQPIYRSLGSVGFEDEQSDSPTPETMPPMLTKQRANFNFVDASADGLLD